MIRLQKYLAMCGVASRRNSEKMILDGRVSVNPADAGLIEYGALNACSVADHQSGRKGC